MVRPVVSSPDARVERNGYRPLNLQPVQRLEQTVGPEPCIGPHRNRTTGPGPAGPADGLGNEMGVSLP